MPTAQTDPRHGPLVATAIVAAIGNGAAFRKGREFAAWMGLVPKQYSTGGKAKLASISKRGKPVYRIGLYTGRGFRRSGTRRISSWPGEQNLHKQAGYIDADFLHPQTFPLQSDGGPDIAVRTVSRQNAVGL
ncbi:MAG: transposase [Acidobacteriota bacterium]|nr:transposase [Acidobacteriota bacterium]